MNNALVEFLISLGFTFVPAKAHVDEHWTTTVSDDFRALDVQIFPGDRVCYVTDGECNALHFRKNTLEELVACAEDYCDAALERLERYEARDAEQAALSEYEDQRDLSYYSDREDYGP